MHLVFLFLYLQWVYILYTVQYLCIVNVFEFENDCIMNMHTLSVATVVIILLALLLSGVPCIVQYGNVSYQWTSTEVESFVHGASGENILQDIVTAFDAEIHRCTVTDELGLTLAFTILYR